MLDCEAVADALRDPDADPRLDAERVRCLPGAPGAGAVVLVGVVHDHPASVFRVTRLVERFAPDVLALELPPSRSRCSGSTPATAARRDSAAR
jgi:hypothetical protein